MDHNTKYNVQLSFTDLTDIVRSTQAPYLGSTILATTAHSLNLIHNSMVEEHTTTKQKLDAMIRLQERCEEKLVDVRARLLEFLQSGGDHRPSVIAEINDIINLAKI